MAQAQLGHAQEAWRLFTEISPAHRSSHPLHGPLYRLEPYAVAADVYTEAPYTGQGGWSWTTGSAAWLHRAALGSILGLQREGSRVRFSPCLPPHWPEAMVVIRQGGQRYRFHLLAEGSAPAGAAELHLGTWLDLAMEKGGSWWLRLPGVQTGRALP
jgi:cyclic beta-1,2-glucan synthetase